MNCGAVSTFQDSEIRKTINQLPFAHSIFDDLIRIKVAPESKFMEEILNERYVSSDNFVFKFPGRFKYKYLIVLKATLPVKT